jgi:hypothetical protein
MAKARRKPPSDLGIPEPSMTLPYSNFSSNNRLILSKLDWLIGFLEAREDEYTTKALNAAHEIRSLMGDE